MKKLSLILLTLIVLPIIWCSSKEQESTFDKKVLCEEKAVNFLNSTNYVQGNRKAYWYNKKLDTCLLSYFESQDSSDWTYYEYYVRDILWGKVVYHCDTFESNDPYQFDYDECLVPWIEKMGEYELE